MIYLIYTAAIGHGFTPRQLDHLAVKLIEVGTGQVKPGMNEPTYNTVFVTMSLSNKLCGCYFSVLLNYRCKQFYVILGVPIVNQTEKVF